MLQFYVIPNRLGNKNENYVAGIFLQGSKKVTKALSFYSVGASQEDLHEASFELVVSNKGYLGELDADN